MKVVSTDALTKLIQLIKSSFISVNDTVTASTVELATVATTGDYDDLINKPTIPSAVTESTVSGWGFTKNTGTVTSVNNNQPVGGNVTLTATDVSALADSTKYGAGLSYSSNELQLLDQDGNNLGTAVTISGGGTSAAAWGSITGTLSAQTDLQTALDGKQATLVSGTNIKTINNTSVLGSGNIEATQVVFEDWTVS